MFSLICCEAEELGEIGFKLNSRDMCIISYIHLQTKYHRYNTSLTKVTDAFETITEYKREVSDLVPRHQKALDMVKEHVGFVEAQRGQYIQVSNLTL